MFHFVLFQFAATQIHLFIDIECNAHGYEEGRVILNTTEQNSVVYVNYIGEAQKRSAIAEALRASADFI